MRGFWDGDLNNDLVICTLFSYFPCSLVNKFVYWLKKKKKEE